MTIEPAGLVACSRTLFLILLFVVTIPLMLESCSYRYCDTYGSSYRTETREVALKGKKKAYSQGYSIYKRQEKKSG
jgi:hypothetical protein